MRSTKLLKKFRSNFLKLRVITIILLIIMLPNDMEDLKDRIGKFLLSIDYNKSIVNFVVKDFEILLILLAIFAAFYLLTCVLLGIGAVLCQPRLCHPFVYVHGLLIVLHLFYYTVLFKYLMNLASLPVDEHHTSSFGLVEVIFFLTLGILYVFFDIYLEICVSSFVEVVEKLRKEVIRRTMQPVFPFVFKTRGFEKRKPHTSLVSVEGALFTNAFLKQ